MLVQAQDRKGRLIDGVIVQAGACTIAGGATGFAYLTRVIAEADSIQPSTIVPIMAVLDMDSGPLRQISLLLAAYRYQRRSSSCLYLLSSF